MYFLLMKIVDFYCLRIILDKRIQFIISVLQTKARLLSPALLFFHQLIAILLLSPNKRKFVHLTILKKDFALENLQKMENLKKEPQI